MSQARLIRAALATVCLLEIGRIAGIPGLELPGTEVATASSEGGNGVGLRIEHTLGAVNPRLDGVTRARIAHAILRCERDHALDPDLVLAVLLVESSARPDARSSKGAIGLMQVMPHMFAELPLPGNVAHIEANVEAGCLLLADNIRRLGEERGISAYFWGGSIQGDRYLRRVRSVQDTLALGPKTKDSSGDG
jgi:hypothetical protein